MASFKPVRLAYNTYEPACDTNQDLAPIIYLHGLTAQKESWVEIPQVVANATKRMSYSLDARNHGDSEWSDHFNYDVNVEDLIHFMDGQGIKKAIIVGQSMGGLTALKTALKKPERVEKIVVEDFSVRKVPKSMQGAVTAFLSQVRKALEEMPEGLEEEEAKKFIMKHVFDRLTPEVKKMAAGRSAEDSESRARFLSLRRGADGRFTLKCNLDVIEKALHNRDTLDSDLKGQFGGPAFFIYGKISPFKVGADEHHIKEFFPNATLEGIEDAGHDVHNSKPLEFTDALLRFLL